MTKVIDVEQGSEEWLRLKLSIISASEFKRAISKGQTFKNYLVEKVTGAILDKVEVIELENFDWGHEQEESARTLYEFIKGDRVDLAGIGVLDDSGYIGASPDGLVGTSGCIEVKSPAASKKHVEAMLYGMPSEHKPQIQGVMWVWEREWCDFISYDPRFPTKEIYIERVHRDDKYINDVLEPKVNEAALTFEAAMEKLKNEH